jgi:hexokinase
VENNFPIHVLLKKNFQIIISKSNIFSCLAMFVLDRKIQDETLPLGFTFSFPLQQEGLNKATLVKWTKGFNCAGVEGEDVVGLLQEALERRGDVKIEVCAILNDTTGCLMR